MRLNALRLSPDEGARLAALLDRFDGPVAVALSGGGDSMFALHAVLSQMRSRAVVALIVDHALRDGAADDAAFAAAAARAAGAEAQVLRWSHDGPRTRQQERARDARHALIARACAELGVRVAVFGHTLDDQAETVAMRLARRATVRGLAAMTALAPSPAWPEGRDVAIARPFLGVRRADMRRRLADAGVAWRDDPSNAATEFERVRVRRALARLEAAGFDPAGLARLAAAAARADAEIRARAAAILDATVVWEEGVARVRSWPESGAAAPARLRALEAVLAGAAGRTRPCSEAALIRLSTALAGADFRSKTLAGAQAFRSRDGVVHVARDPGAVLGRRDRGARPLEPVALGAGEFWDGRFELAEDAVVRPLGAAKQDPVNHVAPSARASHPVVVDGGETRPARGRWLGAAIAARLVSPQAPESWANPSQPPQSLGVAPHNAHVR